MRFKHQAKLLNMYKKDSIYEKSVDGYRIQFVQNCKTILFRKIPCMTFMVDRTINAQEQESILSFHHYPGTKIIFKSVHVHHDMVCLYTKINNKNIDIVMNNMYHMIEAFIKLDISSSDEKTYARYKYNICNYAYDDQLLINI